MIWLLIVAKPELAFLFRSTEMFLLYVFMDAWNLCPDINMMCLAWDPASFIEEIAVALKKCGV